MSTTLVQGRRFAVLGAARSGLAAARLLGAHGALPFVSDARDTPALREACAGLGREGIAWELGGHTDRVLQTDVIVISPGVPLDVPIVREAQARGIPIRGELEVGSWFARGPMVGLTGTNGKTTTTTLVGAMFRQDGKPVVVAGNIGSALCGVVQEAPAGATLVLEISSFQLETIDRFHCGVAALLNVTPDHLDRYPSMAAYVDAKCALVRNQTAADAYVYNADDPLVRDTPRRGAARPIPFTLGPPPDPGIGVLDGTITWRSAGRPEALLPAQDLRIPGPHNLQNALAAAAMARLSGVHDAAIAETLRSFTGLEHRMEPAGRLDGVNYINDSKATNVDAVKYALRSIPGPVILIAGGRDKNGDFPALNDDIRARVKGLVLIGEAAATMERAWGTLVPVVTRTIHFGEAVEAARRCAMPGDTVLLSPACASFDMFRDYADRGRQFKALVRAMGAEGG